MAVKRTLVAATLAGILFFTITGCGPQHVRTAVPAQASAPAIRSGSGSSGPDSSGAIAQSASGESADSNISNRDQQIIASVERKYHSGLEKYQTGDMAGAKKDFNAAVDQLMMCGVNLQTDKPLRAEFDRVVGSVDTLELDALKQGLETGENTQTPVSIANNVTFPVNPKVLAQAEAELKTTKSDLPLQLNNYVASYINFFQNTKRGHDTLVASLEREGRYKSMIERVLRENHLPQDLIYMAFGESGFRPTAMNPSSGAGGMWQFMPYGYGAYGLKHNAWVDERFDPVKSTEAYARLIKQYYSKFDDWYLAIAAYDWGPLYVQRAVQHTGYASFWQLYKHNVLPAETRNYVPIFLAVAIMAKNPQQYGLADVKTDPPLQYDTVQTNHEVSLQLVSDITGAPVQQLEAMNPSLLRGVTPPGESFDLRIPIGSKESFEHDIAMVPPDKRSSWRFHFVQPGDTLASIAAQYHVSKDELAAVNQIDAPSDLTQLDAVVVPERAPRFMPGHAILYRVRRGDTLIAIADRFGVSVRELRIWNHMRGNMIHIGHLLRIAAPTRHAYRYGSSDAHGRVTYSRSAHASVYIIHRGDNLGGIANRFHISVANLRRWNHIHGNLIHVGQRLYVTDPATLSSQHPARASHRSGHSSAQTHATFYRVRRGDTVGGIADRFHISVRDLRLWNHLRGNLIHAGQRLRVAR
jgi:membrane-bound lytic murein transglycosylase D